jgi:uncharacterized protein YukE
MSRQVIAADYENVKSMIQNMNAKVSEVEASVDKILQGISTATEWRGVDATAYKVVLQSYARRIRRSARWLNRLNGTISSHANALYERAINDNSSSTFR